MNVTYKFKDLADVARHFRSIGTQRRESATGVRLNSRKRELIVEAATWESAADMLAATKLEEGGV